VLVVGHLNSARAYDAATLEEVAHWEQSFRTAGDLDGEVVGLAAWDEIAVARPGQRARIVPASGVREVVTADVDGHLVAAVGSTTGPINLYDVGSGVPIGTPLTGHDAVIEQLAVVMLDDRPILVSAGKDNTIRVWDRLVCTWRAKTPPIGVVIARSVGTPLDGRRSPPAGPCCPGPLISRLARGRQACALLRCGAMADLFGVPTADSTRCRSSSALLLGGSVHRCGMCRGSSGCPTDRAACFVIDSSSIRPSAAMSWSRRSARYLASSIARRSALSISSQAKRATLRVGGSMVIAISCSPRGSTTPSQ
jgi:hypothetical protein